MRYNIQNDFSALKIMSPFICLGLGISLIYVIILFCIRKTYAKNKNTSKKLEHIMRSKKHNSVYVLIVIGWSALTIFGIISFIKNISIIYSSFTPVLVTLLTINTIFIIFFWLNGTKDIVYCLFYYLKKKPILEKERSILEAELPEIYQNKKVYLLYCTCDDFIVDSLIQSMNQTYQNIETFILDDSKDETYIKEIDSFAKKFPVTIIRREDHSGFKAGNLNHFLEQQDNYDYFVILDSDEIIPSNFVQDALHFFAYYSNIGILQASHISTRNRTKFMTRFSIGVDSHWPTYQSIKDQYGFLSFLGHGAMISSECYRAVGAFPPLVAEDISFTIDAKLKGYFTVFSNHIICQEEYPIDYFAFKKRHLKWTGGNFDFIRHYSKKIIFSDQLKWYEKLDVILFTYSLPLSSIFFIFLSINLVLLPVLGYSAGYPLWLMTPTMIFLIAPMFNDMIFLLDKISTFTYVRYLFESFLLYGSLYWLSLYGATKALFGIKPKFIITPKKEQEYFLYEMVLGNIQEIIFSFVLIIISIFFTHSLLPVILIVVPSLSGIYLTSLYKTIDSENKNSTLTKKEIEY